MLTLAFSVLKSQNWWQFPCYLPLLSVDSLWCTLLLVLISVWCLRLCETKMCHITVSVNLLTERIISALKMLVYDYWYWQRHSEQFFQKLLTDFFVFFFLLTLKDVSYMLINLMYLFCLYCKRFFFLLPSWSRGPIV